MSKLTKNIVENITNMILNDMTKEFEISWPNAFKLYLKNAVDLAYREGKIKAYSKILNKE